MQSKRSVGRVVGLGPSLLVNLRFARPVGADGLQLHLVQPFEIEVGSAIARLEFQLALEGGPGAV